MKKMKIIVALLGGLLFISCQKLDITFPTTDVNANTAELRVLNVMPLPATTQNSDTLLLNGIRCSMVSTAIGNYYPLSTPRYFSVPTGNVSVSLNFPTIKTSTTTTPGFVYTGTIANLQQGKWSAYIYNMSQSPFLLQDTEDVPTLDAWADTACFIKVANFFYKADGVTPFGPITLKAKKNIAGADWETVAQNVAYQTQSATYYKYNLKNTGNAHPWSGAESNITVAFFDQNGNQYQQFTNAAGTKGAYSLGSQSYAKGRVYVYYLSGKEGTTGNADQYIRLNNYAIK